MENAEPQVSASPSTPIKASGDGKVSAGDVFEYFLENTDAQESPKEEEKEELKEDKSGLADELNNKEPEKKEEKKEEEKKDEKDEKKDDKKDEKDEKAHEKTEKGKKVVKIGDKDLDPSSTTKVKVDGIEQDVTVQDLINDYSGRKAIDKRFTEIDKTRKSLESEKNSLKAEKEFLKNEVLWMRQGLEKVVSDFERTGKFDGNPLEVVEGLLDKMGLNSHHFNRALFEHMLPKAAEFLDMSDIERKAYLLEQENKYHSSISEKQRLRLARETEQQQDQLKLREMKLNHGVNDETYALLEKELIDLGEEDVTPEKVVGYFKAKPFIERADKVLSSVGIDPQEAMDVRNKAAEMLIRYPDMTDDKLLYVITGKSKADEVAKKLEDKPKFTEDKKTKKTQGLTEEDEENINYYFRG